MITEILKIYHPIIKNYSVKKFKKVANSHALLISFDFSGGYQLFIKDYLFLNGNRKYSYHFQDKNGNMIFRYDNMPHWPDVKSYPYHKHSKNKIIESSVMTIEKVFEEISTFFKCKEPQ